MRLPVCTPHRPFDRLWQPGHPFRPRRSSGRRWCMSVALIFLSSVIASYWALTDPIRLRAMAQTYLSELAGGPVSVSSASLSLLQGLRLTDVTVRTDGGEADAVLFQARQIDISYDPASLLRGRLEATRIVADGPHVTLVESVDTGRWNYQRLRPRRVGGGKPGPGGAGRPVPLPQLVLRNAMIDYAELAGGRLVARGSMDVEGRLFPSADASRYLFELQSRGAVEGVGPVVAGQVQLRADAAGQAPAGQVDATLAHFRFGHDVEAMLPREVRDFWQAHQLQGAVDIPEFRYTPATNGHRPTFHLRTRLSHVRLVVRPQELDPTGPATGAPPLAVDDVTGEYTFDPDGLRFAGVRGSLLGNTFAATGAIGGYSADAPLHVRIETPPDRPLHLPPTLPDLASLPGPVRDAYGQLKPSGTGTVWVQVDRPTAGAPPRVDARLTITAGAFDCVWFPYPVHNATGTVTVGPDPARGFQRVHLVDVAGYGTPGGPNADRLIHLDGWVGPLTPAVGCGIHASGRDIAAEPALVAAFPPPVREALRIFQGTRGEPTPDFRGDFACSVDMPVGVGTTAVVTADVQLHDGSGRLAPFPYPLDHLSGQLHVRDGYVDLQDVRLRRDAATLAVDGRVTWTTGPGAADPRPDLSLVARNVPLDEALLAVLPPAAGRLARRNNVAGLLDVDGRVTAGHPPGWRLRPPPAAAGAATPDVAYDLDVALHHGAARTGPFAVTDVTAAVTVRPEAITIRAAHARRGAADLAATGTVDLPPDRPALVRLAGSAHDLPLDGPLHDLLPPPAVRAWDALAPRGTVDADLACTVVADDVTPADYRVTVRPRDLTVCPVAAPYRLDHVGGTVTVDPVHVEVAAVHGTHGRASLTLSGHGLTDHPDRWDLSLATRDLPVDDDLRRALPPAIRTAVDRTRFHGTMDLDLPTLNYRGTNGTGTDAADLDIGGTARASGASLDIGVPVDRVAGGTAFDARVRSGRLAAVRGDLDLDTLSLADRPITHLRAHFDQPAGSDTVRLTDVRADVAGGQMAGRVDLRFPPDPTTPGPSTTAPTTGPSGGGYAVTLALTDADVAALAGSAVAASRPVHGRLSASLDLQGDWADPASRRGRGDVLVAGQDMYQIPLVLGLLEVTDLALPTAAPFDRATARYAVDGRRVTFEQLQVRGDGLVMTGAGWLDFATRRVRMNFTTDATRTVRVPLLHDLWQGAKGELLQIQVRGTVQEPRVSAASLHTFTTTVDEVFRGSDPDR